MFKKKTKKNEIKSLILGPRFKRKKKVRYYSKKNKTKTKKSLNKGPLFKRKKSIHFSHGYKIAKDIKKEVEKRYNILTGLVVFAVFVLMGGLFFVQIVQNEQYKTELKTLTQKTVDGPTAPRGRMYDRNGKLIVDNVADKVIYYQRPNETTTKDEISVAYRLADMIDVDYSRLSENDLKTFWVRTNKEKAKKKITKKEWNSLEERKISNSDVDKLKIERVTEDDLSEYDDYDKEAIYIYTLMNTGYSYAEKVIKDGNVTDEEYAMVAENISKLNGVNTKLDWQRVYPYGDTFKTLFGKVSTSKSGIPAELKDYYLAKGYNLNDRVGISYLEYQYEDVLKGEKNRYQVLNDGTYNLIHEGKRGTDIVLSIDIELQKDLDSILAEEVMNTKGETNTEFYNRSFVIITDPNTGEILAMSGKQYKDGKIVDYLPGLLTSPVVMGSAVKGASQIVGYNTGALKIGEVRNDTCVKIAATPEKCSWKYLGSLNDINAIAQSSNTYQFYTAMKVGKGRYNYNQPLVIDKEAFNTYRNTFAQFGLGVKTEIDLPVESLGFKGEQTNPGLLLDFSIGQYDTYTPIQLAQYIGTIANGGKRMQLHLYKGLYDGDNIVKDEFEPKELNKIETKAEYLDRVKQGFEAVLKYGTGAGYIDMAYKPAGKTGTSQSFIDTNDDGKVDKETITTTFTSYAPYDKPRVTFTIISPDVSRSDGRTTYQSNVNKRLASRISQKYFEIYP
ncbi:MAG: penicillin-binding protein 2 [Bacilli bacterium]|nr:penicillin-binding protein 2 [Bacilli bacterium]